MEKPDNVINRSEAYGKMVANIIHEWAGSDNFNLSSEGYVLPVFAGAYELTPPNFPPPVGPFLKNSRPFLQTTASIMPPIPVAYSEDIDSDFYKAAQEVYEISFMLTDDIKSRVNFWADAGGPGVGVPGPAHILSIIISVLKSENAKLPKAAEIFAKTGIAFKDAFYGIWKIKYQYNLLRQISFIHKHIDPNWNSYLITPPYPDYPSGLAGIYTPAMQILIREFGDIIVTEQAVGLGIISRLVVRECPVVQISLTWFFFK